MSKRREHWDDDLIDAVNREMSITDITYQDEDIYRIIAAVEDWQFDKGHAAAAMLEFLERAEKAETKIQRVRELHTVYETDWGTVCRNCQHRWPCPTIRALDGESDE